MAISPFKARLPAIHPYFDPHCKAAAEVLE
jgi:hypothetical protein